MRHSIEDEAAPTAARSPAVAKKTVGIPRGSASSKRTNLKIIHDEERARQFRPVGEDSMRNNHGSPIDRRTQFLRSFKTNLNNSHSRDGNNAGNGIDAGEGSLSNNSCKSNNSINNITSNKETQSRLPNGHTTTHVTIEHCLADLDLQVDGSEVKRGHDRADPDCNKNTNNKNNSKNNILMVSSSPRPQRVNNNDDGDDEYAGYEVYNALEVSGSDISPSEAESTYSYQTYTDTEIICTSACEPPSYVSISATGHDGNKNNNKGAKDSHTNSGGQPQGMLKPPRKDKKGRLQRQDRHKASSPQNLPTNEEFHMSSMISNHNNVRYSESNRNTSLQIPNYSNHNSFSNTSSTMQRNKCIGKSRSLDYSDDSGGGDSHSYRSNNSGRRSRSTSGRSNQHHRHNNTADSKRSTSNNLDSYDKRNGIVFNKMTSFDGVSRSKEDGTRIPSVDDLEYTDVEEDMKRIGRRGKEYRVDNSISRSKSEDNIGCDDTRHGDTLLIREQGRENRGFEKSTENTRM